MTNKPAMPVVSALNEAARLQLGLADRVLLIYLANRMNGSGVCWPSQALLAHECGLTERQVRRSRDALCKLGLIDFSAGDGRTPSRYWLLLPGSEQQTRLPETRQFRKDAVRADSESSQGGHKVLPESPSRADSESSQGGHKVQTRADSESAESTKKESTKEERDSCPARAGRANGHPVDVAHNAKAPRRRRPPTSPANGFAEFYDRYPRKVARRRAEKAYAQALARGATEAEILAGLERHRFSPDPQFRPHPATWLNDSRWLDEPAAPALSPQDEIRQRWNLSSFITPSPTTGD